MAHAYTPGLTVTEQILVRKRRRLPLLGDVLVEPGALVEPDQVVARTEIPGNPLTVNVANKMSLEAEDVPGVMLKKAGESVEEGEAIARRTSFFGLIKNEVKSPIKGTIDTISPLTGVVTLREPPIPVELTAYIKGKVAEVIKSEGAVIEAVASLVQGIFGIGGERHGVLRLIARDPAEPLTATQIDDSCRGQIVVGGSLVTADAMKKAVAVGAVGLVAGGIIDRDMVDFLGYDIGVAITGHEDIPITVIVTEGFGQISMADKTFNLLKGLSGRQASINGATQIRAGVMRPEIVVPLPGALEQGVGPVTEVDLEPGTVIRIIREPYFGMLATVTKLPPDLEPIETEARVRVLTADLPDGQRITIPRANVELIEG